MKVLLINPPLFNIITTTVSREIDDIDSTLPPLGLMYVAGYLEKYSQYKVKILDCPFEKLNYKQIQDRVKEENPEVVGISCLTFTLVDVFKTIRAVKKANPKIKIVVGGVHVNIYPKETMQNQKIDFLVLGEGEKTFKDLLDNLNNPEKLRQIPGLVFRSNGEIVITGAPGLIQDLDGLPFPARHLTNYQEYSSSLATRFPVTTMFSSRGCPFQCLFCHRPHFKRIFRARDAQNVVDELEQCKKMGIEEIFLYDDTFTVDKKRTLEICAEIQRRDLDIAWDVRARVDTVDKETLLALKKAGCQRIHFGVEAGTEKILKVLRKGITLEKVQETIKLAKEIGIQALAYFMIGSPTETKEDILETFKFIKKINPDFVLISIVTPFPATDLYLLGLEKKILPRDYWQEFAQNPDPDFKPYFWEENFTKDELRKLAQKGYRSFYLRPSFMIKRLLAIRSWRELKAKIAAGFQLLGISV